MELLAPRPTSNLENFKGLHSFLSPILAHFFAFKSSFDTLLAIFVFTVIMVLCLSLFWAFHICSVIITFFNLLGRMFASIVALLGLVFPSLVVQAAVSTFSRSTSVSVKRETVRSMELEWIWAICVSLLGQKPTASEDARFKLFPTSPAWFFSPLTNVSPLSCSLVILKTTWLLATVSYASARGVGKASAGIVGHVSRQLIMHIWSLGLMQVQTLRLDVLGRLGVANFALHERTVGKPFFGLRLGQITFFDLCVPQCLRRWTLALIYRHLDPDQRGGGYSPTQMREHATVNRTFCLEENMDFADSMPRQNVSQPQGYKEDSFISIILSPSSGGLAAHSEGWNLTALRPSIAEFPITGSVICITSDKYSATKCYEVCGEDEQSFCDRPFECARWLSAATSDTPPTSFDNLDTEFLETRKITFVILQQIRDVPPTQQLGYLSFANIPMVLNMVCFHSDIKLGSLNDTKHFDLGLVTFKCDDSVQRIRHSEFAPQSWINEAYLSQLCTTLKTKFGMEGTNALNGEDYNRDVGNLETYIFHMRIGALCK